MPETPSTWYIVGDGGMVVRHEQGELVAPDTIDFGSVEIHTTKDATFSLQNIGRDTLNVTPRPTVQGSPDFTSNATAAKINPMENISFNVRFAPTQSGQALAQLVIVNDGILGNKTIVLKGIGASKSVCIDVPQTNLDFGDVKVDSSKILLFEIKSTCSDTLHGALSLKRGTASPYSFTGPTLFAVPPGASFVSNISFVPTDTGLISDTVIISSDALDTLNGMRYVDVRGVGREAHLQITKVGGDSIVDFRTSVATVKDSTLYLTNSGNATLTIDTIQIVNDVDTVFQFGYKPTLPLTLLATQTDSVKLRFAPKRVRISNAKLEVFSTAPEVKDIILLRGKGEQSTDVADALPITDELFLYQNSPNPFSGQTQIHFRFPQNEKKGVFEIHDMLGREVYREYPETKTTNIIFNRGDLPNGVYMYSLSSSATTVSKRMIIAK